MPIAIALAKAFPRMCNKAKEWYRKAADKGHADAQYKLGLLHLREGLPKEDLDEARAAGWFEKAATQKHADAQFELALLHLRNPPSNPFDEFDGQWLTVVFQQALGSNAQRTNHVQSDSVKGMAWLRAAAENGVTVHRSIWEQGISTVKACLKTLSNPCVVAQGH